MKKYFLLGYCLCSYLIGLSQKLPEIIPPSPTAYNLGQFGNVQIGMFTGTVSTNIPLFEYKAGKINLPISLGYSSNGIKVDEVCGNVGLGWRLQIGGVISRVVRGGPDELRGTNITQSILNNYSGTDALNYFYLLGNDPNIDSQIDIFSFNFLGNQGRFVLNGDDIVLLDQLPYTVEKTSTGFKIVDDSGIKYYFRDYETTRTKSTANPTSNWSLRARTAWYLSEIEHPFGDRVYFHYSHQNYAFVTGNSQSIITNKTNNTCSTGNPQEIQTGKTSITSNWIDIEGKVLDSITSNRNRNQKVLLNNVRRTGNGNHYLVSNMQLINENSKTIEDIKLGYKTTLNNRIFLSFVNFKDPDKSYELEYISPESFPQRLSFNQDHWGYYNGKNNTDLVPNPNTVRYSIYTALLGYKIGADKEPHSDYAKIGMLKTIHYPTKGSTEFIYEGNEVYSREEVLPPKYTVEVDGDTDEYQNNWFFDSEIIDEIGQGQIVPFRYGAYPDHSGNCSGRGDDLYRVSIQITNLTSSQTNILKTSDGNGSYNNAGNSIYLTEGIPQKSLYAHLLPGNQYRISIDNKFSCTKAYASLTYYKGESDHIMKNITVGGLRLRKTIDKTSLAQNNIKTYYYGHKENLNISSAEDVETPYYLDEMKVSYQCPTSGQNGLYCPLTIISYYQITSQSIRNLYPSERYPLATYSAVTVSNGGENFENGGVEHTFYTSKDSHGNLIYGKFIEGSSLDNYGWKNGMPRKVETFKKEGNDYIILKEKSYYFTRDSRISDEVFGFTVKKEYDNLECISNNPFNDKTEYDIRNLSVMVNRLKSNWHYLDSIKLIEYDQNGQNPLETNTKYIYDNKDHLQLSRTVTIDSKGNELYTRTLYPDDITEVTSLGTGNLELSVEQKQIIDLLKGNNLGRIAEPIQNEVYKNNVLQSFERRNYINKGGNLVLLDTLKTFKKSAGMDSRIVYRNYDTYGNPLEIKNANGPSTTYLWGYSGQYPIAKIENATTTEIESKLGSVSNIDESDFSAINNLRNTLPNAMITTYEYEPLVGVTKITDPRGQEITYYYDEFNRLKTVLDDNMRLLQEYKYNYKNN